MIPFLCVDHVTAVNHHATGIAGCGRGLRHAVQIHIGLRSRITDTADAGREQYAEIDPLIVEIITPCEVVFRKYRTEINVIHIVVLDGYVAVLVHFDIPVVVIDQIGIGIEVTQCSARFKDIFGLTQPLDLQSLFGDEFAGLGMHIVVNQFHDLVLVPREGKVRRPTEIAPLVLIAERRFDTRIADVARLEIDRRITR